MRNKKVTLPLYKSSTSEKLNCLAENIHWSKLLVGTNKKYENFLQSLLDRKFYKTDNESFSVRGIATDTRVKSTDVAKWISQIYEDVISLNAEKPELFKESGIRHDIYFKHYENKASFTLWLPQTPREYEGFTFYFIKAVMGTDYFWVREVRHYFENGDYRVHLTLDGEELNKYRELLVDKALFYGVLHFMDHHEKYKIEVDKMLREEYRNG